MGKLYLSFLFLILSFNLFSQAEKNAGEYYYKSNSNGYEISYKLSLLKDGTFSFTSFSKVPQGISQNSQEYTEGNWKIEDSLEDTNSIQFYGYQKPTIPKENLTFNMNKSKARITKEKINDSMGYNTRITFTDSDIFWIKGITLTKM